MAGKKPAKNFEESVSELEQVVRRLESGELSLDDSLKSFETGIRLARECEERLKEAKGKVEQLIKTETGEMVEAPFQPNEG